MVIESHSQSHVQSVGRRVRVIVTFTIAKWHEIWRKRESIRTEMTTDMDKTLQKKAGDLFVGLHIFRAVDAFFDDFYSAT